LDWHRLPGSLMGRTGIVADRLITQARACRVELAPTPGRHSDSIAAASS
jgi:hypothetical protein